MSDCPGRMSVSGPKVSMKREPSLAKMKQFRIGRCWLLDILITAQADQSGILITLEKKTRIVRMFGHCMLAILLRLPEQLEGTVLLGRTINVSKRGMLDGVIIQQYEYIFPCNLRHGSAGARKSHLIGMIFTHLRKRALSARKRIVVHSSFTSVPRLPAMTV
jgi:hypothetical protein